MGRDCKWTIMHLLRFKNNGTLEELKLASARPPYEITFLTDTLLAISLHSPRARHFSLQRKPERNEIKFNFDQLTVHPSVHILVMLEAGKSEGAIVVEGLVQRLLVFAVCVFICSWLAVSIYRHGLPSDVGDLLGIFAGAGIFGVVPAITLAPWFVSVFWDVLRLRKLRDRIRRGILLQGDLRD